MTELKPCKRCGGEAEVFSHYSGVYERIHGFAECKSCKQRVWGKVSFNTYEVNTQHPNFPEWKRNVYERVEKSIVEEWNKVMG
jgi:hypothetical protein